MNANNSSFELSSNMWAKRVPEGVVGTLATSSNFFKCNEPNGYQPWKTIVSLSSISLNPIIPV